MPKSISKIFNIVKVNPFMLLITVSVILSSVGLLATPYYKLSVLPGLAVFAILFLSRNPQIGYYIIILLVPFSTFKTSAALSVSRLVAVCVTIVILFQFVLKKNKNFHLKSKMWIWLLFFLILNLLSTLLSDYKATSTFGMQRILVGYIIFAMTLIFVTEKVFSDILPKLLIWSISASAFASIAGYIFNISFFVRNSNTANSRVTGGAGDPNKYSSLLIFALPLLIHLLVYTRKPFIKAVACILILIDLLSIALTFSRGGAIILFIVLFFLLVTYRRMFTPRYFGLSFTSLIIAFVVMVSLVPDAYWTRLQSVTGSKDSAIGERKSHLIVGWQTFKQNPIIGVGPNSYREAYAKTIYARQFRSGKDRANTKTGFKRVAHNSYIEVITGSGILGFIIYICILIYTIRNFIYARKKFRYNGNEKMASLVNTYTISFVSFLLYSFMLSGIYYHKYLWISLAISCVATRLSDQNSGHTIDEAQIENA